MCVIFQCYYNAIDKSEILNIRKYLMVKKNNVWTYLAIFYWIIKF